MMSGIKSVGSVWNRGSHSNPTCDTDAQGNPVMDPLLRDVPTVKGFKVLGPCVLYRKIAQGDLGVVYQGRHLNLDVEVAVKCLCPGSEGRDEEFVARVRHEATVAARINHPNVVRIYDASECNGVHYIIMEYVEGETALHRVIRKGPLPWREACRIVIGTGKGLAEVHRLGIVHHRVRPDNILISVSGEAKLSSFRLVTIPEEKTKATGVNSHSGTWNYMPPEQWKNILDVGPTADVWSLGATFYFLLTGDALVKGEMTNGVLNHLSEELIPGLLKRRPDLPGQICRIIDRATQRDPSARYAIALEFVDALQGCQCHDKSCLHATATAEDSAAHRQLSGPSEETIAGIKESLSLASKSRKAGARTRLRVLPKRRAILTLASAVLSAAMLWAVISSSHYNRGVLLDNKGSAKSVPSSAETVAMPGANRTDYLLLLANEANRRTFLNPMTDEILQAVHWRGGSSHNLPQIPPPKFSPGQTVNITMVWDWVNVKGHPIACIDVYGDWNPDAIGPNTNELYHESVTLKPGGPTSHRIDFSFVAPSSSGLHRIRWMYTYCFDDSFHISSFYGGKEVEANVSAAEAWTELLFEVGD